LRAIKVSRLTPTEVVRGRRFNASMAAFAGPSAPSAEKLRGGYYTPDAVARFLASWVGEAGPRLLEPSCGDGAILARLAELPTADEVVGIELNEVEAHRAARRSPRARVVPSDLFTWFDQSQCSAWDGIAGNPPFIRFQNWTDEYRDRAFDLMRSAGLRPTRLTNAWVPFTVASALALRPGGRLGLVLPAELLQVTYAAELRAFLVDAFAELTAVAFRTLLFDGVLQEVVLLLGVRGAGPAAIRIVEVDDAASLPSPPSKVTAVPHAPALLHDREKWTRYLLPPEEIDTLRRIRSESGLQALVQLAEVDVGIVTGRNAFFVLTPEQSTDLQVRDYCRPLVSKSAHLRGVVVSVRDLDSLRQENARCELLTVSEADKLSRPLRAYIAAGEGAEIHRGYKCSIRRKWWVVPSVWTPDAFLLRQIYDHPRIVANDAAVTSTDTIHRVRVKAGIDPKQLAAASVNSVTFAFAEVLGRSYGGGVLELEPREAEELPFPDPSLLAADVGVRVDGLMREGRLLDALDLVDGELLVAGLGMKRADVAHLRSVWERLRDRRLLRGKRQRRDNAGGNVLAA
jgi:adenine-specific DNA methylase